MPQSREAPSPRQADTAASSATSAEVGSATSRPAPESREPSTPASEPRTSPASDDLIEAANALHRLMALATEPAATGAAELVGVLTPAGAHLRTNASAQSTPAQDGAPGGTPGGTAPAGPEPTPSGGAPSSGASGAGGGGAPMFLAVLCAAIAAMTQAIRSLVRPRPTARSIALVLVVERPG
jgi:hypothetical protein